MGSEMCIRDSSQHQSMTSVKKDDVIDLLRTTAYWTSINFELGALIKGPLKNYATVLRAEDLVQPDMDHFRRDATGKKPEKYQAAQKVMQELTTLLKLPAKLSNTLGSHEHMKQNLRRFTIHREKFVYRTDSPIIEVQTRIAEKTLELFGYSLVSLYLGVRADRWSVELYTPTCLMRKRCAAVAVPRPHHWCAGSRLAMASATLFPVAGLDSLPAIAGSALGGF